ncbi:MAG: thioredoxin domain-containing protein, partial [Natrialbaceae archaeon]
MTAPTDRNRLDGEGSPYLQAHADNPVHWQPWDERALSAAEREDKPIFLSIGYAACHWCHVMAEESFEDGDTAAVLNETYVPIKVDREERPDVDRIYQTLAQLLGQQGGWPLSVWLTPDGRPFYVGTYFPPDSRGGRPGFTKLLEDLGATWENDREGIEDRADQWADAISGQLEGTPTPADAGDVQGDEVLRAGVEAAVRTADREFGGWGSGGPKFPQPGRLQLLLRADARFGAESPAEDSALGEIPAVLTESLDAMIEGGLYDHVGGGFHRYATDREWSVPHFEKMLYDNAEIPRVLLDAYRATGNDRYAQVVRETFDFLDRELSHPEGGFYSTLDARSEGEEGKYYVWTPEQVRAAVAEETNVSLVLERHGITEDGNFEDGRTVLTIAASVEKLATQSGLDAKDVRDRLDRARE